jgi:hypothetical protein
MQGQLALTGTIDAPGHACLRRIGFDIATFKYDIHEKLLFSMIKWHHPGEA